MPFYMKGSPLKAVEISDNEKLSKVKAPEESLKLASTLLNPEVLKDKVEVRKSGTTKQEARLEKTKNKAAKIKSDYNEGPRGQAEGRAAKAKHNRLNKRAARIEKRIERKNKK